MTCSRRLFKHDIDVGTLAQIVKAEVPPPTQVVPGYPPALEQVVMKALSRRAEDRFQSVDEMRKAIVQVLAQTGPPIGSSELSTLMRSTFTDRIKIKSRLREKCESGVSDATSLLAALGDSDTLDFSVVTAKDGVGISALFADPPKRRGMVGVAIGAAAVAAVLVTALFLLLKPGQSGPETGAVRVRSTPPGAQVFLDGEGPLGTTPYALEAVERGSHEIEVQLDGHERFSERLRVEPGSQVIIEAALTKSAPAADSIADGGAKAPAQAGVADAASRPRKHPPRGKKPRPPAGEPGKLALNTIPWSEVWLGKQRLGVTPLVGVDLPAGRHTLKLLPQGKKPARTVRIQIKPGEYLRKEMKLD